MNELAMKYWNDVVRQLNIDEHAKVRAYRFGDTPDELAQLVVDGVKTATCNALKLYELNNRPVPQGGDYHIILNKAFEPVCVIQITSVTIKKYDEIDEQFAIAEGDGSYKNWDDIHVRFFTEQLGLFNESFHRQIELVCQTFRVVHIHHAYKK